MSLGNRKQFLTMAALMMIKKTTFLCIFIVGKCNYIFFSRIVTNIKRIYPNQLRKQILAPGRARHYGRTLKSDFSMNPIYH